MYPKLIIYDIQPIVDLIEPQVLSGISNSQMSKFILTWAIETLRSSNTVLFCYSILEANQFHLSNFKEHIYEVQSPVAILLTRIIKMPRELHPINVRNVKLKRGSLYLFY